MEKQEFAHLDCSDKRILMRVDYNVPLDEQGKCVDDRRIRASIPSIQALLAKGAKVILISHLGRPKGRKDSRYSLQGCIAPLQKLLGKEVSFCDECVGEKPLAMAQAMTPGEVLLLENVRFHSGEEHPEQEPGFAEQLAGLADLYVNDAFGTAHRKHTSTYEVPKLFPNSAYLGLLMAKEVHYLKKTFDHPLRPFIAIVGGAKVSSKFGILKALMQKADRVIVGGGMAFTFWKAMGFEIGNSLVEEELLPAAQELLQSEKLLIPKDACIASSLDQVGIRQHICREEGIPLGQMGVDIGPLTVEEIRSAIADAASIFWNGPLGVVENPLFAWGTDQVGHLLSESKAIKVVGGGDSAAALQKLGLADKMTHISTGGGASLELIEHGTLPALEVLTDPCLTC